MGKNTEALLQAEEVCNKDAPRWSGMLSRFVVFSMMFNGCSLV